MSKPKTKVEAAEWGSRMVEVRVRFWTDKIADGGKGMILPKHAWDSGEIRIASNKAHGIHPGEPLTFNSLAEVPAKLEKLFVQEGIQIHLGKRQRRYLVT
jgi:hypothetical protein